MSGNRRQNRKHDGPDAREISEAAGEIASMIQQARDRMAAAGMLKEWDRLTAESDVDEPEPKAKPPALKRRKTATKKQPPKRGRKK